MTTDEKVVDINGQNNAFVLSRNLNPKSKHFINYIHLDTDNVIEYNSTKFKWELSEDSSLKKTGLINVNFPLDRIISMRLARCMFANVNLTEHTTFLTNPRKRFAIGFEEFNTQAFVPPSRRRYHFIQKRYDSMGMNHTTTSFDDDRGWFHFTQKYAGPKSLTMSIWDLYNDTFITQPQIKYSMSMSVHLNMSIIEGFALVNWIQIDAADKNKFKLINGYSEDWVFSDFTTADPVADAAVIAAWNTTAKLRLLLDAKSNGRYYFTRDIDLSGITIFSTEITFTATCPYFPRYTTTLELVTEIDENRRIE